jgi:hypothetical protein
MGALAYLSAHGLDAERMPGNQIAVWPELSITPEIENWIIQHKEELIAELRHYPAPEQSEPDAIGRAEAWKPAHESMINHLMACTACHAPTRRYCEQGAGLRRIYEDAHEQHATGLQSQNEQPTDRGEDHDH